MCADFAVHDGHRETERYKAVEYPITFPNNPHIHILLTDRPMNPNGFCVKKNRDWNKKECICQWREMWARLQNREFERKGLLVRVSHESLEAQGVNRKPTKHLGRSVIEQEMRGILTERGNKNREIISRNKERAERRLEYEKNQMFEHSFDFSR